ncbi:MAG: PEGA domain-containing protein [Myxococcales bacterium]|nr:PEGA domain-containing protein [Myxococcales bacterium]
MSSRTLDWSKPSRRFAVALLFAVATLCAGAAAWADDDKAQARKHFDRALELTDEGALREAVVEFRRAYEISPHYSVLYNLGMAYVGLGRPVEAVDALERYLSEGGAEIAETRRAQVTADLGRQRARIAEVTVTVKPDGASVLLDGVPLALTPLESPVRLGIGRHEISIRKDGFKPIDRSITVAGEERTSLRIELVRTDSPRGAAGVGQLVLRCGIPGVDVVVDDRVLAKTPLSAPLLVPQGVHDVVFRRPGYTTSRSAVTVLDGATDPVECQIAPQTRLPNSLAAHVSVAASEPGAKVFVNGLPVTADSMLPVGPHRLEVSRAGFRSWTLDLALSPGERRSVRAQLVPTPDTLRDYKSRAKTQRTLAWVAGGAGLALGAVAVGTFIWNDGRFSEWERENSALDGEWSKSPPHPPDLSQRQQENDDRLSSIQAWDKGVVGLGIAGGALLATGVVLWVTGDDPGRYDGLSMESAGRDGARLHFTRRW